MKIKTEDYYKTKTSTEAIIDLAFDIKSGNVTKKTVKRELELIAQHYKKPFLASEVVKQPKPWDKKYLEKLENKVTFGATSPEHFLYMAEVADYVYKPRRIAKMIAIILGVVVLIILVIILLKTLYFK